MVLVSIGLPVFNGENYVEEAVRSVLAQSHDDLELVISDNASDDRTREICHDLAAADRRIRYIRQERNLGAAPNYNRVYAESRGAYFKWLAHDDRIKPDYVAETVAALEASPDAVLCNTVVEYIDCEGRALGLYRSPLVLAGGSRPATRLAAMVLRSHTCIDFFAMIRRQAMVSSLLHQPFSGADKAFLAQMALRGRMIQLDRPLLEIREHPNRYTRRIKTSRMRLAWHDTTREGVIDLPTLRLIRTYRQLVESENLSDADRIACRQVLRQFWFRNWSLGRLAADLISIPFPRTVSVAFRIKYLLFGAPGNFL